MAEPDVLTVRVAWRDFLIHARGETPEEQDAHLKDYLETFGLRPRDTRYRIVQVNDLDRDCVVYQQVLRPEGATHEGERS